MFVPLQLLAFLQGLFTFYHEGYELAHEFEPYKQQLQFNLQNVSLPTHSLGSGGWGVGRCTQMQPGHVMRFRGLSYLDTMSKVFTNG